MLFLKNYSVSFYVSGRKWFEFVIVWGFFKVLEILIVYFIKIMKIVFCNIVFVISIFIGYYKFILVLI